RQRNIICDPSQPHNTAVRLVVLSPVVQEITQLPTDAQAFIRARRAEVVGHPIALSYNYWSSADVLNAVLPLGQDE
ncbi:hypothetical protein SARC_15222, partial [Sphaeroforma arctica JP610]